MTPSAVVQRAPDRPAVIMAAGGDVVTFADLEKRSNQVAHVFRERGIRQGGSVAILLENHPRFHEILWAAQRSGLYYTAINTHLTLDEAAHIVDDCGATLIVSSAHLATVAEGLTAQRVPRVELRLMVDGAIQGWESYEDATEGQPGHPIDDEAEGDFMLYSSGTTGRPKGIKRELSLTPFGTKPDPVGPFLQALAFGDGCVYLSPAPLYHAAPLAWTMAAQRLGGTVVVMERFDPSETLELVERHLVTHSQMVPTM
ncbi:MAG TPA: AMP-binding protein, partial [Acidimicrobiales bacterium]|nr:AMP-binding protein [Acidimicrobiales bacterium]